MAQSSQSVSQHAENFLDKVPPQNLEAEMCLLGSIILDNQQIGDALELVGADSFYKHAHQVIFRQMIELYDNRKPIDLVILNDELEKKGMLEEAGGTEYLTTLVSSVPSASHSQYYAKIVKEKSVLRNLLTTCSGIIKEAYESTADSEELLDTAEKLIFDVTKKRTVTASISIKDVLKSVFNKISSDEKRHLSGLETGLTDLDNQTGGLHPSQLVIIAGRPSMGKTSFALKIIQHVGVHMLKPALFFSFEMDSEQIALNMVCSEAKVSSFHIRKGTHTNEDYEKILNVAGKVSEAPIYIDDTPGLSIFDLRARARRLKAEKDIQLIVVDYLQLMEYRARGVDNRQQEIATLSRGFKSLARELDIPVIVLSQLNRAAETRDTNRPRMSDLRESGAIEQDADVVMMLYREDYYKPETSKKNIAEVIIAKQRNGPVGTVETVFLKEYMRFENAAKTVDFEPIIESDAMM